MIARRIAALLFVPLMVAFGAGVYVYLGTLKSKVVKEQPQLPNVTKPKFVLPGTMYVVQGGRLFRLNGGSFTEIGPSGDWSQPTLTPDHTQMIAVQRTGFSSDLYLLDLNGHVIKRLTKNDSRIVEANHWVFYPRVSPDGTSIFFGYDSPKHSSIEPAVDLSIWSMPITGKQTQARRWTDPFWYTGGDVNPVPLNNGGVLFVRHSIDNSTAVHAQIYLQPRPLALAKALTTPADDCSQPALSHDGTQVAMICTYGKQTASLEVASFNGTTLGPRRVLLQSGLYASPAWAPDNSALAYFAPAGMAGHFQLWWLPLAPAATPSATASGTAAASASTPATPPATPPVPVQVTQGVDLTATSAPAWY